MKTTHSKLALLVIAASLSASLAACGGSSSSTSSQPPPGTTANLFLRGTISARSASAITVNGVTLTTPPTASIEGESHPESDLKVGMVVTVKAHGSGHSAEGLEVQFEDAVKGEVESKDASGLVVGGQLVHVDDATEFEDDVSRLASIAGGSRVRVSGVPDDRGGLRATRIEHTSDVAHQLELKGWVSDLTASGFTLKLSPDAAASGTYAVTLAAGVALPAGLANGAFVEVRSAQAIQAGNAILATGVVLEDGAAGEAGHETELEGIVTSGTSDAFVVNGASITTSASTRWDGGLPTDLIVGVKVEAEGVLGADGVLAAQRVSFRASVRLIGTVKALAGTGTDTSFTINGVPVRGDAFTDWRTAPATLAAGDVVEVRGSADRTGLAVVASRAEVRSGGNLRPVLQGLATAFDATGKTVTILGQTVAADAGTELHAHPDVSGADGTMMAPADFFAGLTAGVSVVKATGQNGADWSAGPTGFARALEVEGED